MTTSPTQEAARSRGSPTELPLSSTRSRVSALVVGVLLLLLAANEAARVLLRRATPNLGYALVPQKWALLEARESPVPWLVLGDSSCNQGIDPAVLAHELGGDALNLCTVASNLALDAAWMLERHLERLGPPAGVALVHSFHLWHRPFQVTSLAHVPLGWGFWSRLEPRVELDAAATLRSFVARRIPLVAESWSLARLLKEPWKSRRPYRVDERGFMPVARPNPRAVERDALQRLAWLAEQDTLRLSAPNRAALERIAARADRDGFEVFLLHAPIYRAVAEHPDYRRYRVQIDALLEQLASRHARVHFVPREHAFGRDEMDAADHLIAEAAARYTRAVAEEIARRRPRHLAVGADP